MPSPETAAWFRSTLARSLDDLTSHQGRLSSALNKRKSELASMQDRLLNAYLAGTVEEVIYKAKSSELARDAARTDEVRCELEAGSVSKPANAPMSAAG